jgi:hypothetical protein
MDQEEEPLLLQQVEGLLGSKGVSGRILYDFCDGVKAV